MVSGDVYALEEHGNISLPIGRDLSSLLRRQVIETGQKAETEYWLKKRNRHCALVDVQLHTGRTHQIRVHFSAIGCPLLGDELYDGALDQGIDRLLFLNVSSSFQKRTAFFYAAISRRYGDNSQNDLNRSNY